MRCGLHECRWVDVEMPTRHMTQPIRDLHKNLLGLRLFWENLSPRRFWYAKKVSKLVFRDETTRRVSQAMNLCWSSETSSLSSSKIKLKQHRSTVTSSSVRNRWTYTRSWDAKRFSARNRVAQNASSVPTSSNWTTTSARLKAGNTPSVKYYLATSPATRSVSKRVSAQGRSRASSSHPVTFMTLSLSRLLFFSSLAQTRQRARQIRLLKQRLRRLQLESAGLHKHLRRSPRVLLNVNYLR